MRRFSFGGILFLSLVAALSCIVEIEPELTRFDDLFVVEGLITDQLTRHRIKLSKTIPINSNESRPVSNAEVEVVISDNSVIQFNETEPGMYYSITPFAATHGRTYTLRIATEEGQNYESSPVVLVQTPPIDTVYTEFTDEEQITDPTFRDLGRFDIYFDVRNNETSTRAFRYLWSETYKLQVPNASYWKWLGGNEFQFREAPEIQEEFCYRMDSSSQIILGESLTSTGEIVRFPIHSFNYNRQIEHRYSFEVVQYGLSEVANKYWKALAKISQSQGTLFDLQPGSITGNVRNVTDPNQIVLGIFEVTQESRYRVFYYSSSFFDQGFAALNIYWLDCDELLLEVVPASIAGAFMQANNDRYELTDFLSGGLAQFAPKRCALCTLYGSNIKPNYWID